MVAKYNNELLSSLRRLKSSQEAISSKVEGALKRISDNEEKGMIPKTIVCDAFSLRDRIVVGFTTTFAISACHHYAVSWNPAHAEVYSIQNYVIAFVSDIRQVFSRYASFLHQ